MPDRTSFEQRAAWMRERQAARRVPIAAPVPADCYGEHLTPADVAEILRLSKDKVKEMFRREPGVIVISGPGGPNTRRYATLRIPRAVFERVYRRFTKV